MPATQPPLMEIAIEPKSKAEREKLDVALAELAAEDPLFHVSIDPESGQTIIKGMGELHLDGKIEMLKHGYKVDADIGAPQVAYRETITRQATVDYTHKKQTGRQRQYARIKIVAKPGETGSGFVFANGIVGDALPKEFISAVENGLERQMTAGVIAGFPVADVKVSLLDGAAHNVDSSAMAFEIAARAAMREALQKGGPVLLEPVMKVEVATPEDYAGSIIGGLKSRRGRILSEVRGSGSASATGIGAMVPLANMFGYANDLRWISQRRATFTMTFDHYAPVPLPDDDPPFDQATGMRA